MTSIDDQWAERGLSHELLARARAAGVSASHLERMLTWNVTEQRIQDEVTWTERLNDGRMRFRQIAPTDDATFRELWANSPETIGDWDVTVERGANAFAQFELQERPVLNGLFDGTTMVACVSFAIRRTTVGGQDIIVHYGQAMRVHREHRGMQYAHWVRSLPWAVGIGRATHLQYDYIRSGNMTMESWNRKFMPDVASVPKRADEVPGVPVTVQQFPARETGATAGVRKARVEDLARCVELLNRTHGGRDLYREHTLSSLMDRLDAGLPPGLRGLPRPYSIDDFYVLERGGELVACGGLWDRGRDVLERWRHRETGEERAMTVASLLDYGFAEGQADTMAALIEHLVGVAGGLGRDFLTAPLETLPAVAELLAGREPVPETRYLQWRAKQPAITAPTYLDLVYW